jgi:hypothetical protein
MLAYVALSAKYASIAGIAERTFACAAAEFARSRNPRYDGTAMASKMPMMMIGVGLMVGLIIISMYLPMFKLLTLIQ